MLRRLSMMSMMLIAGLVVLATPEQATAQEFRNAFTGAPRPPSLSRVWSGLDFGARIVRPARQAPDARRGARVYLLLHESSWRTRFDPPLQESPWRHVPATQGHRGDLVRAPLFEVSQFAAPIDCAMAKPGDPTLDPKFVRRAPTHRAHSGVIIPVAPCRWK